jgi:hypothetical protein
MSSTGSQTLGDFLGDNKCDVLKNAGLLKDCCESNTGMWIGAIILVIFICLFSMSSLYGYMRRKCTEGFCSCGNPINARNKRFAVYNAKDDNTVLDDNYWYDHQNNKYHKFGYGYEPDYDLANYPVHHDLPYGTYGRPNN